VNRRAFVTGLGAVLATPLAAEAQRAPEVGVLVFGTERLSLNGGRRVPELREALRDFGWIDGQNITLKQGFADLNEKRLAVLAQEFVRRGVGSSWRSGLRPPLRRAAPQRASPS